MRNTKKNRTNLEHMARQTKTHFLREQARVTPCGIYAFALSALLLDFTDIEIDVTCRKCRQSIAKAWMKNARLRLEEQEAIDAARLARIGQGGGMRLQTRAALEEQEATDAGRRVMAYQHELARRREAGESHASD